MGYANDHLPGSSATPRLRGEGPAAVHGRLRVLRALRGENLVNSHDFAPLRNQFNIGGYYSASIRLRVSHPLERLVFPCVQIYIVRVMTELSGAENPYV